MFNVVMVSETLIGLLQSSRHACKVDVKLYKPRCGLHILMLLFHMLGL